MQNDREIIEIALPVADAAAMTIKAAQAGISTEEYAGIQCLQAFCGILHPLVAAFHNRTKQEVIGTKTQEVQK